MKEHKIDCATNSIGQIDEASETGCTCNQKELKGKFGLSPQPPRIVSYNSAVTGVEVEQTWEEDLENSKNGWIGSGWFVKGTNYEMIPEEANVEVTDQDKFYNPIYGIWFRPEIFSERL